MNTVPKQTEFLNRHPEIRNVYFWRIRSSEGITAEMVQQNRIYTAVSFSAHCLLWFSRYFFGSSQGSYAILWAGQSSGNCYDATRRSAEPPRKKKSFYFTDKPEQAKIISGRKDNLGLGYCGGYYSDVLAPAFSAIIFCCRCCCRPRFIQVRRDSASGSCSFFISRSVAIMLSPLLYLLEEFLYCIVDWEV